MPLIHISFISTLKYTFIFIFLFIIGGCASQNTNLIDKCEYITGVPHPKTVSSKDIKIEAQGKKEFYELTPSKKFSGIKSANIQESSLILTLVDKFYFEQYVAPISDSVRNQTYEAQPGRALLGTIVSLGTVWIFNHQKFSNFAFGCSDNQILKSLPDLSKKIKTGKSEWRNEFGWHKILVSGFDKNYEFDVKFEGVPVTIDLSEAITNTDLTKKSQFEIICTDCDLIGVEQEEKNVFNESKKSIQLSNDFRPIKPFLIEAKKARLAEEEKIKIMQVERDKENLKTERQSQGVPLENFKTQCKELGYKVGTPDFGNCVLELNEIK